MAAGFAAMMSQLLATGCAIAAAFAGGSPAHAQTPDGVGVDLFEPALGSQNFVTVHGADVVAARQIGIGLYFDYQRDPFTLDRCSTGSASDCAGVMRKASLVQNGLQAYLGGAFGIGGSAQVGLGVPIALSLSSPPSLTSSSGGSGTFSETALGDLLVEGKLKLWQEPRYGLAAAVAGGVTFPTATDERHLAGEGGVTGRLRGILAWRQGSLAAAGNVGVLLRNPVVVAQGDPPMNGSTPSQIEIGPQLLYGASLSVLVPSLPRPVRGIVELFGRHGFSSFLDEAPMEIDVAMRVSLPHAFEASLGGGAGLLRGVGSPLARAFFGLGWAPDFRDRDGDGIPDMDDQCPDQPEDRDGYKDEDGCPDPDNDGDGIPDALDKCPNEPEDFDNFQDEDGCPDPDNDCDGIPDHNDDC